jgi:microcystin-dependent protein
MDYTSSDAYTTDVATGRRLHQQSAAVPTAVTDGDMNGLIWELVRLIELSGITPVAFNKTVPRSYQQIAEAIQAGRLNVAVATGTANALTAAFAPPVVDLVDGMRFFVRATGANTVTDPTFCPNAGVLPNLIIIKGANEALGIGDIRGAGHWLELLYDEALGNMVLLNPANGVASIGTGLVPVGGMIDFPINAVPSGYLVVPIAPTNISRTTYSDLFAVIGTTWGVGDGSTTYGMPWVPADYAVVQANGNVGTLTTGDVKSHTHGVGYASALDTSGGIYAVPGSGTAATSAATGGAANMAAGVRMVKCIRYRG